MLFLAEIACVDYVKVRGGGGGVALLEVGFIDTDMLPNA